MLNIGSNENLLLGATSALKVSISRKTWFRIQWFSVFAATFCFAAGMGFFVGRYWHQPVARTPEQLVQVPDRALPLKPGPWGNLEALPISIEPPEEYLSIQGFEKADRRWHFSSCSAEQLSVLFASDSLTADQREQLNDRSKWVQAPDGVIVSPSNEVVLSLSPTARKEIYGVLSRTPGNLIRCLRCSFPADRFDAIVAGSGLPSETVSLIKKLSFSHGRLVFFCDVPLVLDTLSDYEQKVRLVKTLARKETLLLKLHVMPDSDAHALAEYWTKASWGKDIKPMLESLVKVPGGARLSLVHLLPRLPAEWLFTYPFPSTDAVDLRKDCHWTAFNFFRDTPDPRFTDPSVIRETTEKEYYPVLSDPRYGDIVMLAAPNGSIIHSSVYIADDIVFTKNSSEYLNPYLLMKMSDMLDTFEAFIPENEHLKVLYFRSKNN